MRVASMADDVLEAMGLDKNSTLGSWVSADIVESAGVETVSVFLLNIISGLVCCGCLCCIVFIVCCVGCIKVDKR
jgi:hypothetical protein